MAEPAVYPVIPTDAIVWILMRDLATDAPISGRTLSISAAEDQGAFVDYTPDVTVLDVGNGWYKLSFHDLSIAFTLESRMLPVRVTATGAKANDFVLAAAGGLSADQQGFPYVDFAGILGDNVNAERLYAILNASSALGIAANLTRYNGQPLDMLDTYQARIDVVDDNVGQKDRWVCSWFKDGAPVGSGITDAKLQVVKIEDGQNLISLTDMTAVVGSFRYDTILPAQRILNGRVYKAIVTATIDGEARTFWHHVWRDS